MTLWAHLIAVLKYYCLVFNVVEYVFKCYRNTCHGCYCCLNTENCCLNNNAKQPLSFCEDSRILFCNALICPCYGGVTCPFQVLPRGNSDPLWSFSWWTLKLTRLLGFRLVLFNDLFFCTTFLGSLTPYSRHFFIRIVGASAPKRRPQPSFLWVWSCWTMDPLHSHKAHVGTSLHQPQFTHVVSCDWWKGGGGGSMWGHPSTNHMGELWHLLYHFMWH